MNRRPTRIILWTFGRRRCCSHNRMTFDGMDAKSNEQTACTLSHQHMLPSHEVACSREAEIQTCSMSVDCEAAPQIVGVQQVHSFIRPDRFEYWWNVGSHSTPGPSLDIKQDHEEQRVLDTVTKLHGKSKHSPNHIELERKTQKPRPSEAKRKEQNRRAQQAFRARRQMSLDRTRAELLRLTIENEYLL
jgi:hypothetical protein